MQIAARNAFTVGGGGVPTARDYVQNGLIAMWDGIENAGWGVHDAAATTWVDLTGNGHDGTFLSSPTWYANALHSSTNDGWCSVGKVLTGITETTIQVVVSDWASAAYRWAFNDTARMDSFGVQRYDVATTIAVKAAGARVYITNVSQLTDGGSVAFTVSCSSAGAALGYVNSTQRASFTVDPANIPAQTEKDYAIGQGNTYGSYHHVRIYNRILSAGEMSANYAVDAARFNLPTA